MFEPIQCDASYRIDIIYPIVWYVWSIVSKAFDKSRKMPIDTVMSIVNVFDMLSTKSINAKNVQ